MPITLAPSISLASAAPWRSTRYYDQAHATPLATAATAGMTANTLYASPLFVPNTVTLDRIACRITSGAAAGKLIRLGIYAKDTATNGPGALLVDGGADLAADTPTGLKEHTISLTVAGGTLIYVVVISDGAPTVNSWPVSPRMSLDGYPDTATDPGTSYFATRTYGALPATFPSSPTVAAGGHRLWARVA